MHVARVALLVTGLVGLSACTTDHLAAQPAVRASAVSAAASGSASYLLARPTCGVDAGGATAYVAMNTGGSDMEVVCRMACTIARSDGSSTRFSGGFFLPAGVSDTRLFEETGVPGSTTAPANFTGVSAAWASCEAR